MAVRYMPAYTFSLAVLREEASVMCHSLLEYPLRQQAERDFGSRSNQDDETRLG